MSDAVLRATIKAYDEFTQQFQKFQTELKRTDQTQKQTAQGADQLNRSTSNFFQTIGQLGALYAFQRGLQEVMGIGREFELTIKQAQAVTGDFSRTLRDLAMATKGGNMDVFRPTEMAQAYRELGAAGADTNDIMASTPDVLEFATAALIDMDKSATAVLSTAKAFNIAFTDTEQIVDAYTESMNRGALAGEDFQWIMGSVGAVAKIAGQDFREILSVGSAMRDSGIQAQDAGTSIKAAILQLINPSKEASDTMKALGVNVYDASGKMKQWSEITVEFERALAPFNEQSRNLALTTIFGSDGIRAMATSMNKGSGYLREFTQGLKNSEGATHRMASAMSDTFDGALRKVNANLERMKILMFEDMQQSSVGALGVINTLIVGFNNLDDATRHTIELMIGTVGLVMAIGLVVGALRTLLPLMLGTGTAMSALAGPIGIAVAVLGTLAAGFIAVTTAQAAAKQEGLENARTTTSLGESYLGLENKLRGLKEGTEEYKSTQGQLNQAMQDIARFMPDVVSAWNEEGQAISINIGLLREKIRLSREAMGQDAQANLESSFNSIVKTREKIADLESRVGIAQRFIEKRDIPYTATGFKTPMEQAQADLKTYGKALEDASKELAKYESLNRKYAAMAGLGHAAWDDMSKDPSELFDGLSAATTTPAGTQTFTLPEKGKKPKTPEDLAKEQFEASRKWIDYKKALNLLSAEEEIAAWARVSTRYAEGTDERMQADMEVYRAKQRLVDEDQKRHDDAYSQAMDLMRHEVNMARMSTEQQISYLERLREAHQWTQQQAREIEENMYRLRKQQLSEYLNKLEDEYKSKLDAIEDRTKASIKAIQDQIDALEGEGKASDREEAARKHNDKLKDLEEKRRYHELRTGAEHQKAIADIDKEIAEEKADFQKQQDDWTREDKKDALQKQIDDARKAGDEERRQLEDHYQKARRIAESGIMDIIASLAATGPEWLNTGKELIDQLIAGLESGDFSGVESKIKLISGQASKGSAESKTSGTTGGTQKQPSQMTWQELLVYYKDHVSEAMAEIARAGGVYTAKLAAGNIEGARAAHRWADQIRKAIGQAMVWDPNTEPDSSVHNSYAKGGPILYDQIAKLHAGEYVIPASLVDAIRRSTVPPATTGGVGGDTSSLDRAVDRIVAAIESRMGVKIENLLKIDSFNNEDGTDIDVLMGDVRRAVSNLVR